MPELVESGWSVELVDARVLRIEQRGILVGGVEDTWYRKKRTSFTQVLWAWPMDGGSHKARPPEATFHSIKFLEQLKAHT
ncbi:hypothetical protein [Roseateles chitinivorans]|uniref:hypothetical protein n=1 Tax=Roseateles chitinivorans TaxID=2917965 RepID=UPI00130476AD|nr:hypothetical protein [Roseateles chitinivorans]